MLTLLALIADRDPQALFLVQPTHDRGLDQQTLATVPPSLADKLRLLPPMSQPQFMTLLTALPVVLDTPGTGLQGLAPLCLRAGIPIVTCPGATPDSRVSAYYLQQAGHPELIASDLVEMADLAVALVQDPDRVTALRQMLAATELTGLSSFYPALRDWLRAQITPPTADEGAA
jgi:hypothetical protein